MGRVEHRRSLPGGFITDQFSWRWVFWINLPVGIVAALIIGVALVEPRREERAKIDHAGVAVLTAAVTILLLLLGEGRGSPRVSLLIAIVVVLFALFVFIERRAPDPIVPFALFRHRGGDRHRGRIISLAAHADVGHRVDHLRAPAHPPRHAAAGSRVPFRDLVLRGDAALRALIRRITPRGLVETKHYSKH